LFASGDGGVGDGVSDPATQQCLTNNGKNTTRFHSLFPSTCPFVTSVGGTTEIHEVAATFSGGGFSDYFSRPSYQDAAVNGYFDSIPKNLYDGLFQPVTVVIVCLRRAGKVAGTSAATPTFASIISLLNAARLSKGRSPLGFLNPLLCSKLSGVLNDITTGNNSGCGTSGFNATKGWDPVTGLGSPNLGKLKELVLQL